VIDRHGPPRSSAVARIVAITAAGVAVVWALYLVRDTLLLIYISVLLAIGFGPVVRAIEHQRLVPVGTRRLPRWLAILIVYLGIVSVMTVAGLLVLPPLARQAAELRERLPDLVARGQDLLVRFGLIDHEITLEEAFRSTASSTGDAVVTIAAALTRVGGGIFGFLTILILTFYLLVESDSLFGGFARLFPRGERARVVEVSEKISTKVSAWLSGQLVLASTIGS
jgi:predicted PurR-regulated permease PerM